jgi:hypothetical protein
MVCALKNRLDRHFVACSAVAAAAAVGGATQTTDAAIVYSGTMNFAVPATTFGAYVRLDTFATAGSSSGGPEVNLWGSTSANAWMYPTGTTVNRLVGTSSTVVARVPTGQMIDAGSTYLTSATGGSGFGTNANWGLGTTGYLGYKFEISPGQVRYGWARVQVNTTGGGVPMTLIDMAYETSGAGIPAGAVPAPGSVALLALGAAGLAGRRRK